MFIITVKYTCSIELIDQNLAAHRAFLETNYLKGLLVCSGPQNPRTGGIILSHAPSRELVEQMISEDPFYLNNLAEYEITEFEPVKYAPAFESFINK